MQLCIVCEKKIASNDGEVTCSECGVTIAALIEAWSIRPGSKFDRGNNVIQLCIICEKIGPNDGGMICFECRATIDARYNQHVAARSKPTTAAWFCANIPDDWFLYSLRDDRTRIIFRGEKHVHKFWVCELQHNDGGRLTRGQGASAQEAVNEAIEMVLSQGASK